MQKTIFWLLYEKTVNILVAFFVIMKLTLSFVYAVKTSYEKKTLQNLFRTSLTFSKMLIEIKSWISPVLGSITAS